MPITTQLVAARSRRRRRLNSEREAAAFAFSSCTPPPHPSIPRELVATTTITTKPRVNERSDYLSTTNSKHRPKDEEGWIRRNLRTFYSEKEGASSALGLAGVRRTGYSFQESGMDRDRDSQVFQGRDIIPNGVEKSFKARRSFNSRQRDVDDILLKHPNKIPIIVERSKNEKILGTLDKSKFLVPEELSMSQLTTIIRRRLHLSDTQAFYLIVNRRSMASASSTLSEVYRREKDSDGFLYITYASQEMFG